MARVEYVGCDANGCTARLLPNAQGGAMMWHRVRFGGMSQNGHALTYDVCSHECLMALLREVVALDGRWPDGHPMDT